MSITLFFFAQVPSGALIPQHCLVVMEEDSGKIKSYDETSIPVVITTSPTITQDQAVQIGKDWIYQNVSTDPVAGQFQNDLGGRLPVELKVSVDPLLNETLEYQISYTNIVLTIDAQSGDVIDDDSYANLSTRAYAEAKLSKANREVFWKVLLQHDSPYALSHAAICTNHNVYIWSGYLKTLGVNVAYQRKHIVLSTSKRRLFMPLANRLSDGDKVAWQRKGTVYVPLTTVQAFTGLVKKETTAQEVLFNLNTQMTASKLPKR